MITIWHERCLNTHSQEIKCNICRQQCPTQAISPTLVPDASRCMDCGLCLSACPAEAIGGDYSRLVFERLVDQEDDPLVLTCCRQGGESGWPCLGALDGRLLLVLLYRGHKEARQVILDDSACVQCNSRVAAYLADLRSAVNELMIYSGRGSAILSQSVKTVPRREKAISRRAFFSELIETAFITVREAAMASTEGGKPIDRHELFIRYVPQTELELPVSSSLFRNMVISERCNACKICLGECSHQAVTAQDGGRELRFFHNPLLCSGCGVCAAHCPREALSLKPAARLDTYPVATRQFPNCTSCGAVFQPAGNRETCLECLLKASAANFVDGNNMPGKVTLNVGRTPEEE